MTKYCLKCGKDNEDDSTYCMNCGEKLFKLHRVNTNNEDKISNKNKEMALIGVVVVLVLAIAIVGVFALMSSDENESINFFGNNNESNEVSTITSSSIPLSDVNGLAQTLENELQTKDISEISSIKYKGITFTKQQCLYIFAKAIEMKNKGIEGNIDYKSFGPPDDPLYGVSSFYLTKSEYVDMAQRTVAWMDNNGIAPNYTGVIVAGSPDFGYDGLVIVFAIVIIESENGILPPIISW